MTLADFSQNESEKEWTMSMIGGSSNKSTDDDKSSSSCEEKKLFESRQWTRGRNSFVLKKTKSKNLGFRGAIYEIGGMAEISTPLKFENDEHLDNYEGIVLRVRGDGNNYAVILTTSQSYHYLKCILNIIIN